MTPVLRPILLPLTCAALAAVACTGTETGNPPFTTGTGFSGYEPMGIAPEPMVTSAWWVIGGVSFVPAGECDAPGEPAVGFEGPAATSLTGEGGDAIEVEAREGEQCALRFTLAPGVESPPGGAPPDLTDASLAIEAEMRDGTPVRFVTDATPTVSLEGSVPFTIGPDEPPVIVGIDWTLLFAGARLFDAEQTGGEILLDATHNPERFATVESNIAASTFLYRDADADGVLDPEEVLQPPLASGAR